MAEYELIFSLLISIFFLISKKIQESKDRTMEMAVLSEYYKNANINFIQMRSFACKVISLQAYLITVSSLWLVSLL